MSNLTYQELLKKEAAKRKWTPSQTNVFEEWRNNVGTVESNNDPSIKQRGGGPGRGKYQYELAVGDGSGANITAVKRFKKYLAKAGYTLNDLPEKEQLELLSDNPDFSTLSSSTQDMIFLADKSLAANTPLDDLVNGKIGQDEAWAKWHWKGSAKETPAKLAQWERNVGPYSNPASMPLEPEQLPSPNERRMQFAQTDPRRVDLASKEPSMFQRAVEGMIPSAQASEADQLRVLMGERAKFAQTDPRRTDLLQQQSRMAQERNFFGGESERNNPNREAIATNLAAQDRQRFAQTDPRRVDLGQPVQRSMPPPAPAPREPRYGGYVTDGSGNVIVDGSGMPVQYGAGPEEYATMEDLLADRGLMGTRGL